MKDRSIKVKIIEQLIYGPKTTGDLAKSLGYEDDEGYGKYNTIRNALNSLYTEKIISKEKIKVEGKPGRIPTVYSITKSIAILRKISKKYPNIIPIIQSEPDYKFLKIIYYIHKDLIFDLVESDIRKSYKLIEKRILGIVVDYIGSQFQYHLSQSPTFYKLCLFNDSDAFEKKCQLFKIYGGFTDDQTSSSTPYPVQTPGAHFTEQPDLIDIAIRACILFDCFEGYYDEHNAKIPTPRYRLAYLYNDFEKKYAERF